MKKMYLVIVFFLVTYSLFAAGETVVVVTNVGDGIAETPSELKPVNPCSALLFKVNINVPSGYVSVGKFEWFVNGLLVKTTTDSGDPALQWTIATKPTNVYCNVTYKTSNGTFSPPSTSTTFTPSIKDINFDNIILSTPSPNYGCTSNTVSFNLNTYTCSGDPICDYVYHVSGQYNITWQPPVGWSQTSISPNGNTVSFVPDALSGGQVTATIHLPCGYTETRTYNVTRVAQVPSFSTTSGFTSCTSSAAISINPVCGASNYTYTINGSPGVTFSANGQQTLTTANTTINVSIAGGSSINTLKAKANYPNSISSADANSSLTAGTPQPGPIHFKLIDPVFGKIQAQIDAVPGATSYNWYKNSALITVPPVHDIFIQFPIPRVCDVEYDIAVEAINGCGTSQQTHQNAYVPCDNYYSISPNPASDNISITVNETNTSNNTISTFDEIKIYDKQGNLKKSQKFNKVKNATVNIGGLTNGIYFVEITAGTFKEKKQLLIQK